MNKVMTAVALIGLATPALAASARYYLEIGELLRRRFKAR